MRIGGVLVLIWLLIGVLAAAQRDYFSGSDANEVVPGLVEVRWRSPA